jgi:hypothetical protein
LLGEIKKKKKNLPKKNSKNTKAFSLRMHTPLQIASTAVAAAECIFK